MSLNCPVCRAVSDQRSQCRRCKADLSMLIAVCGQARRNLALAVACFRAGDLQSAAEYLQESEGLCRSVEAGRLRALLALVERDFDSAWDAYQSASRVAAE